MAMASEILGQPGYWLASGGMTIRMACGTTTSRNAGGTQQAAPSALALGDAANAGARSQMKAAV